MRREEGVEIIHDPGERIPEEKATRSALDLTRQERRWYALGALKSALLIGMVYLAGLAIVIAIILAIWM